MRLGGPIFTSTHDADSWARAVRQAGYGAAYAPLDETADDATVQSYRKAANDHNLVIAEVGAWSNPIDPDDTKRRHALTLCQQRLDLAERLHARCCVNIAGSRHPEKWDGPHPDNLSADTFDLIVRSVREIVDAVKPQHTVYALETMPWIFPDSPASYRQLILAIDRPGVGVHLDPVNLVNSPARAYHTTALLRECFATLGPWIRSCHAKDIAFTQHLTVHLDECRPGQGVLDYLTFLTEAEKLNPELPVLLEHLPSEAEYTAAADHLRSVAQTAHITLR